MNIFKELSKPFPAEDIEWRVQRAGEKNGKTWAMVLAYVDSRAIRRRLNCVCGPENWQNKFESVGNGVCCYIGIRYDGEWIWKGDGAGETQVEAVKGSFSDALKRAGYAWGIGEYLYDLEVTWANINPNGRLQGQYKSGNQTKYFKYDPPQLPDWAVDDGKPPQKTSTPKPIPVAKKPAPKTGWTAAQNKALWGMAQTLGMDKKDIAMLKGYIAQMYDTSWDEIPAKGKAEDVVNRFADFYDEWKLNSQETS
jgi:hypothetical protein